MLNATFKLAGELVSVKIEGNNLGFFDVGTGQMTTIEGLRLSRAGVLKEHPDLKDEKDWRRIAIDRLKEHMKDLQTEKDKMRYVAFELTKFGYEPIMYQMNGFRPTKKL